MLRPTLTRTWGLWGWTPTPAVRVCLRGTRATHAKTTSRRRWRRWRRRAGVRPVKGFARGGFPRLRRAVWLLPATLLPSFLIRLFRERAAGSGGRTKGRGWFRNGTEVNAWRVGRQWRSKGWWFRAIFVWGNLAQAALMAFFVGSKLKHKFVMSSGGRFIVRNAAFKQADDDGWILSGCTQEENIHHTNLAKLVVVLLKMQLKWFCISLSDLAKTLV